MTVDNQSKQSRREFFRSCGRNAAAAGLTAAGWMLAFGESSPDASPLQSCVNDGVCRGCGRFDACPLPQALSAKRRFAEEGTHGDV